MLMFRILAMFITIVLHGPYVHADVYFLVCYRSKTHYEGIGIPHCNAVLVKAELCIVSLLWTSESKE